MSGTDYTTTPNLGLFKPNANAAVGFWGDLLNSNADAIDAAIHFASGGGPFLPLAGGSVIGPINVTVPPAPIQRSVQASLADAVSVKSFGAVMDGNSHPLSSVYGSLGAAQAVYPHAVSLADEIDWCAIQGAVNTSLTAIRIPAGTALINRPIVSPSTHCITVLGDGVNVATIVQTTAGQDGWQHTSTLGFQLFGMTLACNGIGGTALKLDFSAGSVSQFTLRDVYIVGNILNSGGQLSNYWHDGIYCKNPSITQMDHVWILGSNGGYLGNMGDAIYFKCRVGPPSGSFDIGMRDSRIHSYQRGMVLDSIDDGTGLPTAVNLQGIMLDRVNYGALMQFVTVIGSCLELVLSKCQGASFGSVVQADTGNTVTIRDGLFFASAPGSQGITAQLPQDMIAASGGGLWWIKDNEFLLSPTAAVRYIFNFTNNFLNGWLRDNEVYIAAGATAVGFTNITAGSTNIVESGTVFGNWNVAWPLWMNGNTDTAAGNCVPAFQTVYTRGQPANYQWAAQGTLIGWNYAGSGGRSVFINSRAAAVGGFQWYTTPSSAGATPTLLSTLDASGNLTLNGGGAAQSLILTAASGVQRNYAIQTGGVSRWVIYGTNTAEPNDGSNVGTDLAIGRYTDAGAANGSPLTINRATGLFTFATPARFNSTVGFFNTAPIAKPSVAGAWAGNTAGKALSTALAALGLITDTTTA